MWQDDTAEPVADQLGRTGDPGGVARRHGRRAVEALLSTQPLKGPERVLMPLRERASIAQFGS
jgi:hypothetical protein